MPNGYVLIVLHAHLPYVHHPEYERFLEERWLFEAITDAYIPLIKFFDRLVEDGLKFRLTLSVSPTLCAMLEDPLLRERYARHLELCLRLADAEIERTRGTPELGRLARMYRTLFEEARRTFSERCQTRLLPVFKELADAGVLELITCAATHGYLPGLFSDPTAVRAQVLAAVEEFERIFGYRPKGFWLPECGYYPGLDAVLAEAGLRYTFLDSHGVEHATPKPLFGVNAPLYCPSGVAVFARSPATSKLVWSNRVGYPSDPAYRELHRDIGFDLEQDYLAPYQYAAGVRTATGIKYHRITGPGPHKQLYDPDLGRETAQRHARDFVGRCRDQVNRAAQRMPFAPAVTSMYDAELFGHWWFEGPQWLHFVLRELATSEGGDQDVKLATPYEYLQACPVQQQAVPSPSSWGRDGYSAQWINAKTDWLFAPLHELSRRMARAVFANGSRRPGPLVERQLRQAGRELLLAQSSDWAFAITNQAAAQYAERRFLDHINRCHALLDDLERGEVDTERLAALELMDDLLPELDYRHFAPQLS
jgi:1,4-alpha-glucan branching enzyme